MVNPSIKLTRIPFDGRIVFHVSVCPIFFIRFTVMLVILHGYCEEYWNDRKSTATVLTSQFNLLCLYFQKWACWMIEQFYF